MAGLARVEERSLWLEVQDTVCDLPQVVRETDAISESGRGLFIVEQLAMYWGVRPLAGYAGKIVFALLGPGVSGSGERPRLRRS